jgi:non-heme chloroperoxidase
MGDATVTAMPSAVAADRIAFVDTFAGNFFRAGTRDDLVSEPFRAYNRDIATIASPKATIECIAAFGRTDFRGDLTRSRSRPSSSTATRT